MDPARIMVVEDEQIVGYDIKLRLERMGYEVVGPIASADEVLEKIESCRPDLLLMDIFLNSRLDGIQLADIVRERYKLPVVYLTAYSNEETLERAKRTMPLGFIHKPVADFELRAAMEMALYKHNLEKRLQRSETLRAVTLRNLGEAVLTTDAAGNIEYMNVMAEQLTGYAATEASGQRLDDIIALADEQTLSPLKLCTGDISSSLSMAHAISNCVLQGRANYRIPVEISLSVLREDSDGFDGMVVLLRDISDRERARREIESLQKQLEFVLGETKTNIDIVDTQFNLRYVDSAWRQRYGDYEGRKCYEYFMGRDTPCPTCGIMHAFATKSITVTEETLVRENNRPVQVTSVPYQSEEGDWLVAELNIDITERRRTEMQKNIQRDLALALAAVTSPQAALELFLNATMRLIDFECGCIYLHAAGDDLKLITTRGLTSAQAFGQETISAKHSGRAALETGEPIYALYEDLRRQWPEMPQNDGMRALAVLPILYQSRLIGCCCLASYQQGEVPENLRGTIVLMLDQVGNVIGRIMAEQAVYDSETRHRHLFDNAPVGYHEVDMQGRLCRVNQTELKMLGYTEDEMLERFVWDFIAEPESQAVVQEKLATGNVPAVSYERTYVQRDGSHIPVLVKEYALRDDSGNMLGIRTAIQDITEQKRAQKERARFAARMNEVQKLESIGLLAGGIAHDFNNLLMSIQGNTELALMNASSHTPTGAYLKDIKTACHRAADLTRQLLAYAGKGKYVVEQLSLPALVHEMTQLLHTLIGPMIDLQLELPDDMPPVEADGTQLRQIIMNLISNAVEALPDRSGTIKLTARVIDVDETHQPTPFTANHTLAPGQYCELSVSDTGCGIREHEIKNLFEPFYTTKLMGRGLGLAAVLGIVRNHGGELDVQSQLGVGSTFIVRLPIAPNPKPSPNVSAPAKPIPNTPSAAATEHGTILLVDDDLPILRLVSQYLERRGFCVIQVTDGAEAVTLFTQHAPLLRAVILDLTLPGMSGEDAFRIMQSAHPEVPILVCSGYSEMDASTRFAENDHLSFIQKPYELSKLYEQLTSIMRACNL